MCKYYYLVTVRAVWFALGGRCSQARFGVFPAGFEYAALSRSQVITIQVQGVSEPPFSASPDAAPSTRIVLTD